MNTTIRAPICERRLDGTERHATSRAQCRTEINDGTSSISESTNKTIRSRGGQTILTILRRMMIVNHSLPVGNKNIGVSGKRWAVEVLSADELLFVPALEEADT